MDSSLRSHLPSFSIMHLSLGNSPHFLASKSPLPGGFWVFLGSSRKGLAEIDRGFRVFFLQSNRVPVAASKDTSLFFSRHVRFSCSRDWAVSVLLVLLMPSLDPFKDGIWVSRGLQRGRRRRRRLALSLLALQRNHIILFLFLTGVLGVFGVLPKVAFELVLNRI